MHRSKPECSHPVSVVDRNGLERGNPCGNIEAVEVDPGRTTKDGVVLTVVRAREHFQDGGVAHALTSISGPWLISRSSFSRFSAGWLPCGKPTGFSFS